MDSDERERAHDLDRFWDALLAAGTPETAAGRASDLAETVERLHSALSLPRHFPARWRTWPEVRQASRFVTSGAVEQANPAYTFNANARTARNELTGRAAVATRVPRGWLVNQVATAALLLLTLAVGLLAAPHQTQERAIDSVPVPSFVRALEDVPGEVVDTPLVQARFAATELPPVAPSIFLYRLTLDPGASLTNLVGPACQCMDRVVSHGVGIEQVQSGSYTLRLDTPIRVQHGGSPDDTDLIPAHEELTLHPGDAAIYPDYTTKGLIRNDGVEPVILTGVAIVEVDEVGTDVPILPEGVYGEEFTSTFPSEWRKIPTGPVALTLRHVTIPARASVGPYEPVGLEAIRVEAGQIRRTFFESGLTNSTGQGLVNRQGTVMPFFAMPPGMRQEIASDDDAPLELLVVTIEPAGIWSGALAP